MGSHLWRIRDRVLDLSRHPLVMGIVNVTPDSFSDGGKFLGPDRAVSQALRLVEDGADILDLGGESSRPGADPVSPEEEWRRVEPVLAGLAGRVAVPISIDTWKAEIAKRAIESGAQIVNDITGLTGDPAMVGVVGASGAGVVVMHMQGSPRTMQAEPTYGNVVEEVRRWLADRIQALEESGLSRDRVVVDPGLGFGKTLDHNLEILANLGRFVELGRPVLVGPSRKAFLGGILGLPVGDRVEGTVAASALAVWQGAGVIRVHDVKEVGRAVKIIHACRPYKKTPSVE